MFKGAYQRKLLTILYSGGSNPLEIWSIQVKNGWTRRVKDEDMATIVFEICGTNVATAYIVSPPDPRTTLGITLPFITMFIKNLKRYFTFEIQILDDKKMRRRFRFSNYQSCTKVRPFTCSVPLSLKPGWNQMQLNLANFTMRAYGTNYMETQRVQIHANCRIRRVYFSDRLYTEEELPRDYRIYLNVRQAPQPPPAPESQEELPAPETFKPSPSSILKAPSKVAETMSMMSLEGLSRVSSKSKRSEAKHESVVTASRISQKTSTKSVQPIHWSESVITDSQKRTESRVSRRSLAPEETEAVETQVLVEEVELLQDQETVQQTAEEGGEQPEVGLEPEVEGELVTEPEESTEADSPRSELVTESEFAESEPVPESDVEEVTELADQSALEPEPESESPEPETETETEPEPESEPQPDE